MSSFYVDNCLASVQTQSELDRFIDVAKEIMAERKFDLRGWEHSKTSDPIASPTNVLGMIWDRHCDTLSLIIPDLRELMEETVRVEGVQQSSFAARNGGKAPVGCIFYLKNGLLVMWK
ncbi:hypothetical protein TNCV_634921 [Trichonephila clavipes]|nr:hypothetical protein TNCV_634921 [Trichonephila clavipes]